MRPYRRRGVLLTLVVIVMGIVAGLLSILMNNSVALRRDRQILRVGATADAALESGVAYARAHAREWATTRPAEAVELDIAQILGTRMTGSASITFCAGEPKRCRVRVVVENTNLRAERDAEIAIEPTSALPSS